MDAQVRTLPLTGSFRKDEIRALENEGLFVVEWTDAPHVSYPEHSHAHCEVRVVVAGSMTMGFDGREYTLNRGERIDLPAGHRHWARTGPDGAVYLAATDRHPKRA